MQTNSFLPPRVDGGEATTESYTLKILSGSMYGCDLTLPAGHYFVTFTETQQPEFVHIPENGAQSQPVHASEFSREMQLYIPSALPAPNLSLQLSSANGGEHALVIHFQGGAENRALEENVIIDIPPVRFALKKTGDSWSECVRQNNDLPIALPPADNDIRKVPFKKERRLAVIMLLVLLSSLFAFWAYSDNSERKAISLQQALSSAPGAFRIINWQDNFYLFTHDNQTKIWLDQALYKLNQHNNTKVLWEKQVRDEILSRLLKKGVPVLSIKLDDPVEPQIFLHGRKDSMRADNLLNYFTPSLPFAKNIDINWIDVDNLLSQARHDLDKLQLFYREIKTLRGYSFIISGELNDSKLAMLKSYISDFQKNWGSVYISFSINLNDDLLKDKSYLDAKNGYLFLTPNHLYFPTH